MINATKTIHLAYKCVFIVLRTLSNGNNLWEGLVGKLTFYTDPFFLSSLDFVCRMGHTYKPRDLDEKKAAVIHEVGQF